MKIRAESLLSVRVKLCTGQQPVNLAHTFPSRFRSNMMLSTLCGLEQLAVCRLTQQEKSLSYATALTHQLHVMLYSSAAGLSAHDAGGMQAMSQGLNERHSYI